METAIYRKSTNLPVPQSSNIPKRYKRNASNADLRRSERISTNFDKEIYRISSDYPQIFVESVIRNFENDKIESVKDDYIIPAGFFDIAQPVIITEVPFCTKKKFPQNNLCESFITLLEVNLTYGLNG